MIAAINVRVDIQGTVYGHPLVTTEQALAAVRSLRSRGKDVRFWSSALRALDPEELQILQAVAPVEDKPIRPPAPLPLRGWLMVDDCPELRRTYQRLGAQAVDMVEFISMVDDRTE